MVSKFYICPPTHPYVFSITLRGRQTRSARETEIKLWNHLSGKRFYKKKNELRGVLCILFTQCALRFAFYFINPFPRQIIFEYFEVMLIFASPQGNPCELSLVDFDASNFCYSIVEILFNVIIQNFVAGYRAKYCKNYVKIVIHFIGYTRALMET